jgi:RHS repeat-associated protein
MSCYSLVLPLFLAGGLLAQTPDKPNRTLPPFEPSNTGLRFSAQPSTDELFRAHVFQEPLVPVGGEPGAAENSALAQGLLGYAKRSGPDDFSGLTDFLKSHPQSPWSAALLTDLGLEYYNTAHYSLALEAWKQAWELARSARDFAGRALADRAFGELLRMNARLGRMDEMASLLKSIERRPVTGSPAQLVADAREALWTMQNRPQVAFRCGPLALRSIRLALNMDAASDLEILNSASTQKGCSLPQVADLSKKIGLNYQMAFREKDGEFVTPSVAHWKVGHYAALIRKEGNLYQLQDPTFGNTTWATREALEAETSGYFLVPPGSLAGGWRAVGAQEGAAIWGKGQTLANDSKRFGRHDLKSSSQVCRGMPAPTVHLMMVNLNVNDEPLGYTPPVGPPVRLVVRYNERDSFQPSVLTYGNFGAQWTCDWMAFVTDNPTNQLADVTIYGPGGGVSTFTGFDSNTQTYAPEQFEQSQLTRTGPSTYQLLRRDGSKLIFAQSDGSVSTSRRIWLTQEIDPQGNANTFTYDAAMHLVSVTDAIGQVTTLSYNAPFETNAITRVTDPFGRFATFTYDNAYRLTNITDVIGLSSSLFYFDIHVLNSDGMLIEIIPTDLMTDLFTPYGRTTFFSSAGSGESNTRFLQMTFPDGSHERVEYNQTLNVPQSDPPKTIPQGMNTQNSLLPFRNTYFWDRNAFAQGAGDYSKARLYHFLHTADLSATAGALESTKQPLEARVWYDYPGQGSSIIIGPSTRPAHIGRVLDNGRTQLYTHSYNSFGHLTNSVDPVGRSFSYNYATNGIDLLEVRQTRAGNNELLSKMSYNSQHRPLTATDASGQSTTFTYNPRGQVLTVTDAKNETTTFSYDTNSFLIAVDGPLPGTNDMLKATRDAIGRIQTLTSPSGHTLTYTYDNMDRLNRVTYPDGTFVQFTFDRLHCAAVRDRAGRQTSFEYDSLGQLASKTDPLGRTTRMEWCRCGSVRSLTDPMGRNTSWVTDVQGRRTAKIYPDGSQVSYFYENSTGRLREAVDENHEATFYTYNLDDTLKTLSYSSSSAPALSFVYDPDYQRLASMRDAIGTTTYAYIPIAQSPSLGAGKLARTDGPLQTDSVTYAYDELGREVQVAINGLGWGRTFDADGRLSAETNVLGTFSYIYDGPSHRVLQENFPNGITAARTFGTSLQDFELQQLSYSVGATPVSRFNYGRDFARATITTWSQQAGIQSPSVFSFFYDSADQLVSATVTNGGTQVNSFAYSYDLAGNRLSEQVGLSSRVATFNALNQLSTATPAASPHTNEWDAARRLIAVNAGNQRTELTYDGQGRVASIRLLQNGSEVSLRRFTWRAAELGEERDASGSNVVKSFFPQGVKIETGPNAGTYFYTRDHLRSVRELIDSSGVVRARYSYDPFGRRTLVSGTVQADFGFAGMFWCSEANLALTHFRAYDPETGRWLSRDPLRAAEIRQGPNLYAYVGNEPINRRDPSGLACAGTLCLCGREPGLCAAIIAAGASAAPQASEEAQPFLETCSEFGTALVETITPAAENAGPQIERFETLPGIGPYTMPDVANAAQEAVAELEASPQSPQEILDYLMETGQLNGVRLGPDALNILEQTNAAEQQYYDELRDLLPVADAMRLAHLQTVDEFGVDWNILINLNTSAF